MLFRITLFVLFLIVLSSCVSNLKYKQLLRENPHKVIEMDKDSFKNSAKTINLLLAEMNIIQELVELNI